ncbi:MAG: hypothetical protein HYY62_02960 [Deltaproteobacteria bacterium]|nr:hypothetical protein [Deltaproteobacteria bacterium]
MILSCGEDDSQTVQNPYNQYGNYNGNYNPYGQQYGQYNNGNYNPYGNYPQNQNYPNGYPQYPTYGQKQVCGNGMHPPCPAGFYCNIVSIPGVYTFASTGYCERR